MKKFFQYILMAVALVATASCSNELDEVLQPAGNGSLQFVVSDFPAFGESPETRVIGTQDVGKTAWDKDDQIIVTLTSKKFGAQSAVLTYNGTSWSTAVSFLYLDNETPAVSAIYAPCYEVTEDGVMKLSDGMQLGMTEYIPADCSIANGSISINFTGVKRTYSRLRIAADAGQKLAVTTTGFTPAGATKVATGSYTITADKKGNAYLYGTFAVGGSVTVLDESCVTALAEYEFTEATEPGKSYALYAGKKEEVDLSTLTGTYTITEDGYYEFTGAGSYGIKVESENPTIVLNDASITVSTGSAIDVASGNNATIFVLGDNTIGTTKTESWNEPCGGIFVAEGGTVNITSNSNANILRAHGSHASAIGGKYDYDNNESYNAGNINISNVTVYAYTNNYYAAAIGAAGEGTCGTINITNAVVYAYGAGDQWSSAPGIGSAWSLVDWPDTIPIVIISDSEVHTFRYNPYSDYIGYLGDESGDTYATGNINCGGGSVTNSTIYCYTGLDATTTDKVVTYDADGKPTEQVAE